MVTDIVGNLNYKNMVEKQILELCEYLLENDFEFSITANIEAIKFTPDIPDTISQTFQHFTMFSLMNYTFESAELSSTHLSFEAGFGAENFGSVVEIPLFAIFQIIIDDSILYLNPTATVEKFITQYETQEQRSMNAFKMNINNKNLL